jgi:hypothetical protein
METLCQNRTAPGYFVSSKHNMNSFIRTAYVPIILALTVAAGVAQSSEDNPPTSLNKSDIKFSSLARRLMLQKRDFRYEFFASRKAFETVKRDGLFLLTYGTPNNIKKISTNECSTVEAVLNKYGGGVSNFQVRVVQKDMIMQTPLPKDRNVEAVKALHELRLQPGDVVILTLME